jgi:hypothetical protein
LDDRDEVTEAGMRRKTGRATGAAVVLVLSACGPTATTAVGGAPVTGADAGVDGTVDAAADGGGEPSPADASAADGAAVDTPAADAQAVDTGAAPFDRCKAVIDSVAAAGFDSEVKVSCDGT